MAVHHVVPQPDGDDDDDDDGNFVDSSSQKLTIATTGAVLKLVTLDTTMDTTDDHDEQTLNYSADVIHHFSFSSNGQHAIAGGDHGIVQLWKNIHNDELTSIRLRGMVTHVVSVSFSTDSKYVAAVGMAGAIKVWNVQTASLQQVHPVATSYDPFRTNSNNILIPSGIGQIKFTPDGTMLAATGNDGSIRFWSRDSWDRQP
jgi:WD40 repeat protein